MKTSKLISSLSKIANILDENNLTKEADILTNIMTKLSIKTHCRKCGERLNSEGDCLFCDRQYKLDFEDDNMEDDFVDEKPEDKKLFPCPHCYTDDQMTEDEFLKGYRCDKCSENYEPEQWWMKND